jgi:hypothetical protein
MGAMNQAHLPLGKFVVAALGRIAAISIGWLVVVAIPDASATAQSSPNAQREDHVIVDRWRPTLESYIREPEGKKFEGNFAVESYLGRLDWLGDDHEEVPAGRYFGFSVRLSTRNDLLVEVITTRAVLINDAGKIVGDIEYPNSQLVWPQTHQPYLFGIPALRTTGWRLIAGGSTAWWCSGP